ncbi:MAG TPA: PLDc N-terminal domain-containing protein, partial [Weissella confusa]|nr:PLDc N-terminal domain-containing protein [Weissella confusa]
MIEHWIKIALIVLLIANTLGAIVTVFRDRNRDITTVWAWMLVLLLFPVFG